MNLLATQTYFKVERKVTSIEQIDIEHERVLTLYDEKITTQNREFLMKDIMDMSYREIGDGGGLLYLHTSQGIYSYTVKESPMAFIEVYRSYCQA
ncbi:hypothetical protein [Oceanobacillus manasiensis]|uniref:hypothetical protein n=1 Tax=Oceanobacillus manasiensis TaxID=586413 RepID=UPI0005A985A1|nr:hypothetical protein [Oceanobacillus manasiensis]